MISFRKEVIGPPDCPLMHRWTFVSTPWVKLILHHFLPNADDKDVHDHPRSFVTFILRGSYENLVPCPNDEHEAWPGSACALCVHDRGLALSEVMEPFKVRYRRADHAHRTRVGPDGCWSLVVMGRVTRLWGFWRRGKWWHWKDYEREFGFAMRCEDLNKEYRNRG